MPDYQWEKMFVKKFGIIDGAMVFREYASVWQILEDLSKSQTDKSFKEHASVKAISRDNLLAHLENCLEVGGIDNLDMDRVKGLIEKVELLDPGTLVDIEGV